MFSEFPQEVKLTIFGFLPVIARGKTASVCKEWKMLSDSNYLWKPLLKKGTQFTQSAKETFLNYPHLRAIDFDQESRKKFCKQVDEMNNLTNTQSKHLKSLRVTNQILNKKLSLAAAIERSSEQAIQDLHKITTTENHNLVVNAIEHGISPAEITQCKYDYSYHHYVAVNHFKIPFETIKDLNEIQIEAIYNKLPFVQAMYPNLKPYHIHAVAMLKVNFDEVIKFASQEDVYLYVDRLYGLTELGLTYEQISKKYFAFEHIKAIKLGYSFEEATEYAWDLVESHLLGQASTLRK